MVGLRAFDWSHGMIAVLGAGLQGALCALELADRGAQVTLFDRRKTAITEASLHNEGKIHVGYVYANDRPDRTASLMARGAARFTPFVSRWWESSEVTRTASDPFTYVVMKESLVAPTNLSARYAKIDDQFEAELNCVGTYFNQKRYERAFRLSKTEVQQRYNPDYVVAAFSTSERSVSLPHMADALRRAILDHPRIETVFETTISGVSETAGNRWSVTDTDKKTHGPYRHLINALWGDRLRIDAMLGINCSRPFLMRRKVANRILASATSNDPGSATMVLGAFGDIVRYPDQSYYVSWYPTGCMGRWTRAKLPSSWDLPPASEDLEELFQVSVRELITRIPALEKVLDAPYAVESAPGIIFSWGQSDVDDPSSELHQRFDVGPQTHFGTYHSIDTGKLTLAPMFAEQVADRILPK